MSKIHSLLVNAGFALGLVCIPAIASAASILPSVGAERPVTREAVERETVRAMRAGEIPQGERYGPQFDNPAQTVAGSTLSRVEVERDTVRAMKAGQIPKGELFGQQMAPPIRSTIGSGVNRIDVEREAVRAMRAGTVPRGEFYNPAQGW